MPSDDHELPIRQMLADADEAWRLYDRPGVWLGINNRELLGNLACHVRALVQALDRITCLLRCEITHNPCGTDTWPEGYQCQCRPCRVYVVKKSYMQSGPISEPQEATHGQATIEAQAGPEPVRQVAIRGSGVVGPFGVIHGPILPSRGNYGATSDSDLDAE